MGWGQRIPEVLRKFSSIPVIIAALTAIDQLRGAREVMRQLGDFLKNNLSVPPEFLAVLDEFRQLFQAVANLVFFWVPLNLRSMLLVVTILFGGAVVHYTAFFLMKLLQQLSVMFAPSSWTRAHRVALKRLQQLDVVGEKIREADENLPNLHLTSEEMVALQGESSKLPFNERIVDRRKFKELKKRHASRVKEEEERLRDAADALNDLARRSVSSRILRYLRSHPPRIPVNKYALIVGTLVLCIGVNYMIYPLSGEAFEVIAGDPLREMKIRLYMEHRDDYVHHVTLAFVYSIPVVIFVVATVALDVRSFDVRADMRAVVIIAPLLTVFSIAGWDEVGFFSPLLCIGFCLSMYIIAANLLLAENLGERSWLRRDMAINSRRR